MEQRGEIPAGLSCRFLAAARCSAESLASVYGMGERKQQVGRLQLLLAGESAERIYFAVAGYGTRTVAWLHLCRDNNRPERFRIRGLHTREQFRGQGLATRLLRLGVSSVFQLHGAEEIRSFILPANLPSIRAHRRARFYPLIEQSMQPERHLCFTIRSGKRAAVEENRS